MDHWNDDDVGNDGGYDNLAELKVRQWVRQ